jgi:large subunit ribosomal protein L22
MEAEAHARFMRFAPRKMNQVLQLIRRKPVEKALDILTFTAKAVAAPITKTLHSAIANSGQRKHPKGLTVKEAWVGQGPVLKRMRPGPMGRGMPYKRKTCHLTIVVTDQIPVAAPRRRRAAADKAAASAAKA